MSVEFYHAQSKRSREVPFIDNAKGSMVGHSCSYHTFNIVRNRICAHFNPRLSILWGSLYLMDKYEDEIVSLCNTYVPKPLHILLYQPDCDGSLMPNQCRRNPCPESEDSSSRPPISGNPVGKQYANHKRKES